MAVFVMAVGILSMVVLFPLGLRESTQSRADLKQCMLADYLLNQAVAAASSTDVTWSDWSSWAQNNRPAENSTVSLKFGWSSLPSFVKDKMQTPDWTDAPQDNKQFRIACCLVPGFSDRVMGIMVVSTDLDTFTDYNQFSNNPVYYAEAMFQGTK